MFFKTMYFVLATLAAFAISIAVGVSVVPEQLDLTDALAESLNKVKIPASCLQLSLSSPGLVIQRLAHYVLHFLRRTSTTPTLSCIHIAFDLEGTLVDLQGTEFKTLILGGTGEMYFKVQNTSQSKPFLALEGPYDTDSLIIADPTMSETALFTVLDYDLSVPWYFTRSCYFVGDNVKKNIYGILSIGTQLSAEANQAIDAAIQKYNVTLVSVDQNNC